MVSNVLFYFFTGNSKLITRTYHKAELSGQWSFRVRFMLFKDYSNVLTKDKANLYILSWGSSISVRNLLQSSEVRWAETTAEQNYCIKYSFSFISPREDHLIRFAGLGGGGEGGGNDRTILSATCCLIETFYDRSLFLTEIKKHETTGKRKRWGLGVSILLEVGAKTSHDYFWEPGRGHLGLSRLAGRMKIVHPLRGPHNISWWRHRFWTSAKAVDKTPNMKHPGTRKKNYDKKNYYIKLKLKI